YASMPASAMSTGDYVFTAWAVDRAGNAGPAATQKIHYEDNRAPVLAYSSIPDTVPQNAQASFAVGIGDADMGDSLVLISLDKPAWLTAAPDTGAAHFPARKAFSLTGKPGQTDVGTATVRIQLMDRGGLLHTYTKTLQVQDVNDPPAFADGQEKVAATEDSSTRWTPRFGDPDPSDSHTLILLNGPAFARLEGNEVVIRPGSRDIGSHALRLKVGDGRLADTLETILLVTNVNDPPYAFPSEGWRSPAFWKEDREEAFSVVVVDMDKGDALTLATPMPAFVKVTQSVDSSGINRIFQFVVKPTAKDTGALKSTLIFTDAAGAATQLALSARVLPDNDMPTALIAETRAHAGAARFRLDVKDEDGSLEQARFHYRLVGPAGDTVRRGITAAASLALHPLADGPYTLAVKAEDQDGLRQDSWTTAAFSISGATTLALDSALWHMIGVPQAQLPASAFGEGATLASWDETGDDGQPLSRYASGRAVEALRRGKGYWVRPARPVTLTAAQKDLSSGAFTLKLTRAKQGWNQVANPYPYWVDVSASRLTFWEWDAKRRDLVNAKSLLKPWAAYWVLAPRDTTLILPDQPWFPAAEALAKSARAAGTPGSTGVTFANPGDWSARLSLRAGAYHDAANLFGVRGARGAYRAGSVASRADAAPGDRALPDAPKFGDYLALHFEKTAVTEVMAGAAQGYATDFRDSLNREEEWWDFSVEDAGTGETQAFLSPEGLEPLHAAGLKVFLVRRGE
ncbi:MAG TPA: hypothetical protein VK465_09735, partial [Fibrobacteria bacterium]|nr:hypothetical protein [Fibrobacteria bacterium]